MFPKITSISGKYGRILSVYLLIVVSLALLFCWEGRKGFDPADEGFLWYGARQVLRGAVPLRDFASYDIGRYYWAAAFMKWTGNNGVVALRMSAVIFQALALLIGFGALLAGMSKQKMFFWILALFTLLTWMAPLYRLFDISISIVLIGLMALLVGKPVSHRFFLAGAAVGFVAVFGRNHGLYGIIGSLLVMVYLVMGSGRVGDFWKTFALWISGVVVGYLPMLIFIVFIPGFAPAFWESVRHLLFETRSTNIALPVPWPWLVPFKELSVVDSVRYILRGLFFMAVAGFGIGGIIYIFWKRFKKKETSPVCVAAACFALPYMHYAYSRADLQHLSLGIAPLIIGSFAWGANQVPKIKHALAILLGLSSIFLLLPAHAGWLCCQFRNCSPVHVGDDILRVDLKTAQKITVWNNVVKSLLPRGCALLCVPYCPAAYAMFDLQSPMWDIYALFPRSPAFQEAEIARIKAARPCIAIIDESCLDGRKDRSFRFTHSLVYHYLLDHYERVNDVSYHPGIYKIKNTE